MQITHVNHYVPIWYQKRFMLDGQNAYHCLNKSPEVVPLDTGKKIFLKHIQTKGPKKFFSHVDLYTTRPLGQENDEIEKYLFGEIDTKGAKALQAIISPRWQEELHPHFLFLFEYMDAQKLRTPKGLAWIEKVSRSNSQL